MKRVLISLAALALASCNQARPSDDAPLAPLADAAGETSGVPLPPEASHTEQQAQAIPQRLTQQPQLLPDNRQREKPRQASLYTPPSGSPERVELMNSLRTQTRSELGGDAVFVVRELRSNGEWAFARLNPQWRDGRAIDAERTPLYRNNTDQMFDGLHTEAIWRKVRGRWTVYAHTIGSTDVWWLDHCDTVPHAVLGPGC